MQYALRIVMLLLVIMMSAAPGTARAEGIPAKDGLVQDTAQMLSKKSIASIEKAAKGKLYTFYLLTVDSLNGKAPATYANDVYDQWELGADDILLLICRGFGLGHEGDACLEAADVRRQQAGREAGRKSRRSRSGRRELREGRPCPGQGAHDHEGGATLREEGGAGEAVHVPPGDRRQLQGSGAGRVREQALPGTRIRIR
ncbi:TPM domain-containing protein [Paenibacillus thiaminolyticus]|uniref:TPM domain-containing protein n=1 Tax=Paenibacillus thiaminolyticus TaxID=49283 RepID=UPI00254306CF|nr:TPM domain-containing protein [Paenibacillus thiaminolyticus]WII39118.1 TPM domain-containing protein [Paenibacillus thiaminolyticus]